MATSQVESTRLLHQEIEQHKREMVQDLTRDEKTTKERIINEHRISRRLATILESGQKLLESYDDADGLRKNELEDISGEGVINTFYQRLKSLREYHRKFPGAAVKADPSYEIKVKPKFTSDEGNGKFIDLHPLFARFLNIRMFERCEYLSYLQQFDKFDHISREEKLRGDRSLQYRRYLEDLFTYLKDYYRRTNPLLNVEKLEKMVEDDFKPRWDAKAIEPWFAVGARPQQSRRNKRRKQQQEESISQENTDDMKNENMEDHPRWCKTCKKVYAKDTVFTNHLKGKKHKRHLELEKGKAPVNTAIVKKELLSRLSALLEDKVKAFADLMRDIIQETIKRIERKQTMTLGEIQADLDEVSDQEAEEEHDSENEDTEKPPYNPLNLPLGWDGKPIPYWLYKLHGLNIEYKCEICGDYSYWGPRAFERHFKEWRHSYGMRCLGIPNTNHFMNVTKFRDAQILHEKLKRELQNSGWKPEEEEEFEDNEGNVFNKKTYDDLRRQGLI